MGTIQISVFLLANDHILVEVSDHEPMLTDVWIGLGPDDIVFEEWFNSGEPG